MELERKVAIVTGGAGAIGRQIILRFAEEGMFVVAVDIDNNGLERFSAELKSQNLSILALKANVTDRKDIANVVNRVMETYGKIDILVNNAGYLKYASFLEFDENDWDNIIAVDLKGYFIVGQLVAREMVKKHYGKIVNVSSIGAEIGFPGACAYASAKAGVLGLTKVMALELAPFGIHVNAVSPGPTKTDALNSTIPIEQKKARINRIPFGRLGSTEDIARAVLFLSSENASFITGHVLHVDGGFLSAGAHIRGV